MNFFRIVLTLFCLVAAPMVSLVELGSAESVSKSGPVEDLDAGADKLVIKNNTIKVLFINHQSHVFYFDQPSIQLVLLEIDYPPEELLS